VSDKSISVLALALLTLWICMVAGTSNAIAADPDVAGVWLFDEDMDDEAKDSSGNGNDGMINGGVTWTKDGKFGGALEFDGIDGWVEVPDNDEAEFPAGVDFTIACWLKVTTPEAEPPMIIAKHYFTTSQILPWYGLYYQPAGTMDLYLRDVSSTNYHISGTSHIDDGEWHHFAATRESGTIKLYVDGAEEASMEGADVDVGTNDGALHFMSHYNRFMGGVLDEVFILKRALSDDEIEDLMNNGVAVVLAVSPAGKLPAKWAEIKEALR